MAIIQARLGSSRLPGKVLMELAGAPVIQQVFDRVSMVEGLSKVIVATTVEASDDRLVGYCDKHDIPCFRGSENDVLDRYVQAARWVKADAVMRITADCPYIDPKVSTQVLNLLLDDDECDYATTGVIPTYPDGLDTDVVRMSVLEQLWENIKDPLFREHVTYYIPTHPDEFRIKRLVSPVDYSHHRWTLDRPEDLEMLTQVAAHLAEKSQFGYMEEILAVLDEHPEIAAINAHIPYNEALQNESES
ncbi:MAG: glycosyltransferase family protein [Verrucomicrobia bacterium]|nr:glycosyltransferase family protein [Verrucomicrobiota bacterium]